MVTPHVVSGSLDKIFRELEAGAKSHLREFAHQYGSHDVQPELFNQTGFVADSILLLAEHQAADLIVMGTHGRRGVDHTALGSVTEKVLRKATCPVLVVRKPVHDFADPTWEHNPVRLWKILFCTDFSENSDRALNYAVSLATQYQAQLILIHVLEDLPSEAGIDTATAELVERMERPVPSDLRCRLELRSVVRIGKAHEQIIQLALESKADLVVMGVMGRNALDLALFGSTTHRVIQMGTCPVFVVPPEAKALSKQQVACGVADSIPLLST
jgi:nucleotide-binding universal stress UspA family protein